MKIKWGIAGRRRDGKPFNSMMFITPLSGGWCLYDKHIYSEKEDAIKIVKTKGDHQFYEFKIIRVHNNE
jgi:hypothetical protein